MREYWLKYYSSTEIETVKRWAEYLTFVLGFAVGSPFILINVLKRETKMEYKKKLDGLIKDKKPERLKPHKSYLLSYIYHYHFFPI